MVIKLSSRDTKSGSLQYFVFYLKLKPKEEDFGIVVKRSMVLALFYVVAIPPNPDNYLDRELNQSTIRALN
jgi:hypothetical protein